MATKPVGTERQERCEACNRDTPHDVRIELRAESDDRGENAAFSREPYRVATCRRCDTSRARRMNDA
jgi:CO dehydrogenase/acetyl-CoA synthase alpha subunit